MAFIYYKHIFFDKVFPFYLCQIRAGQKCDKQKLSPGIDSGFTGFRYFFPYPVLRSPHFRNARTFLSQ
jgi:hypothetical protein